jgi:hypothetical protein
MSPQKKAPPKEVIGKGLFQCTLILSLSIASQSPHHAYVLSRPQWVLPGAVYLDVRFQGIWC